MSNHIGTIHAQFEANGELLMQCENVLFNKFLSAKLLKQDFI